MDVRVGPSLTRKFALAGALLFHSAPLVNAGIAFRGPDERGNYCPCKPGSQPGSDGAQVAGEAKDDGWRVTCSDIEPECQWLKHDPIFKTTLPKGPKSCKAALQGKPETFHGLPNGEHGCIDENAIHQYRAKELSEAQCPRGHEALWPACQTCIKKMFTEDYWGWQDVTNYNPGATDNWNTCLEESVVQVQGVDDEKWPGSEGEQGVPLRRGSEGEQETGIIEARSWLCDQHVVFQFLTGEFRC